MKILITGAKGFVGKNLTENLVNIKEGKNKTRPNLIVEDIYLYDIDSTEEELNTKAEGESVLEEAILHIYATT